MRGNRGAKMNLSQIRRLYYWLSYHRYTGFLYGGLLYVPYKVILFILVALAVVFAPYMLYVLYSNGRRGWLAAFAVVVGIPAVLAFVIPASGLVAAAVLHLFPLLTFYFYCYALRFSVGEWVGDASVADEAWINAQDRNKDGF